MKTLRFVWLVVCLLSMAQQAQATITFVAASAYSSTNGSDISAQASQDSSGATYFVAGIADYNSGNATSTISDSRGLTWTALTGDNGGLNSARIRLFYACGTGGVGHTFSTTAASPPNYPSIAVLSFSGVQCSGGFDQVSSANTGSGNTLVQPGSITPANDNEVVVSAEADNGSTDNSVNWGSGVVAATIQTGQVYGGAVYLGMSYVIQTTAAPVNPTWAATGGPAAIYRLASQASFISGSGSPPPSGTHNLVTLGVGN